MLNTLLVDATFLLKKSFLGNKHMYSKNGHIGGLYQFFMTIRMVIKQNNINKVVLCWDGENGGKMRYNIYPKYKANRQGKSWYNKLQLTEAQIKFEEEQEKSMLLQKIRIKNYAEELFFRQIEVDLHEADDLVAYYCKEFHNDEKIIIYTNDRDMCQLLTYDNVSIYLSNMKSLINKDNYFLYFKHHYENLTLIKILCGDKSDNIRGIMGCGETILLKYFPEIKKDQITYQQIREKSKLLNESKKSKIKVLENIEKGIVCEVKGKIKKEIELGDEFFEINEKIIDLKEPILNREGISEVINQATLPLNDEDRGSKNLLKLMKEDQFLEQYTGTFIDFCQPFYSIPLQEKNYLKKVNNII